MGNCFKKSSQTQPKSVTKVNRRPSAVFSPSAGNPYAPESPTNSQNPRLISSEENLHLQLGRLSIRYGYMSQRGYYPDGKFKCYSYVVWMIACYLI